MIWAYNFNKELLSFNEAGAFAPEIFTIYEARMPASATLQ